MSKEIKETVELTASERAEQIRKMRQERKPWEGIGSRFPNLPPRPGYKTHWVNDYRGKIEEALSKGYEFSKRAGFTDDKVDLAKHPNQRIRIRGGSKEDGSDMYQYAMDIPMEIYEEDRKAKAADNKRRIDYIKEGKTDGEDDGIKAISSVTATIKSGFKPD